MKYIKFFAIILCFFLFALFFINPQSAQKTEYVLDTVVNITIYGSGANKAATAVIDELKRIENVFSRYNKESEISKINSLASHSFVKTTDEVFSLIEQSITLSYQSGGAFDITLAPVIDLWQNASVTKVLPPEEEIKDALLKTGYENLILDKKNKSVFFNKDDMSIDMGAVAKGYAADRVVSVLREHNIENALIDLGGNVIVLGKKPLSVFDSIKTKSRTAPFVIGIQDPTGERGSVIETITAQNDCFIITSGDYERYFEIEGARYHHIIDPKTGYPASSGLKSATVICDNGTAGDAFSTAAFILGKNDAKKIKNFCDEVILIDEDKNILTYERN